MHCSNNSIVGHLTADCCETLDAEIWHRGKFKTFLLLSDKHRVKVVGPQTGKKTHKDLLDMRDVYLLSG